MTPVNILIVDDRPENIITLEALLKRDDIRIFSTTSPNDALKLAWENSISIALVDVQMPEMDGFELVEMLKSNPRTKDILVIFVTAISKEAKYAVKGLNAGAVDYLYKPLDPYITSAKVDAFIQLARSQAEIRQKNEELENFALVVKNCADIICTIDAASLRISNINPAIEKILGYKMHEVLDKSIIDLVIEEEQGNLRTRLGEIIRERSTFSSFEFQFQTFDKNTKWMECRASYRGKNIFINISDISPQKSYMEQLIKSKEAAETARKIKENFLANMSHELRTPISGIIGLTKILRDTPVNEQQHGLLDLLEVSSQSLLGVINDILDISKIEAGKFTIVRSPNNVAEICKAVCDLLKFKADEKNIELLTDIDPDIPESLMVDSLRLNQILMNLLSNAIKFTERGYVKLSVKALQHFDTKCKLEFSVEDTGIGIPENRLSKIFDSFEQAEDDTSVKYGGTGLGLAIVKKLIELKGGELSANSQFGVGSVFKFTNWFALATPEETKVKTPKGVKELNAFKDVKVLVAEDNLVNQFMITKILKDWQAQVEVVNNGKKVLEKLTETDYDIVLMDTHMPEMDGIEAAKTIRINFDEPKRSIPIISLSAAIAEHEQEFAVGSGMNEVLSKPFHPHELHAKMSKLLKIK
ncbi:response regulator [Mucilaginibacter sp. RS28]|uniref:Sensory/regulatory protein RpfC n=1 Tax=Mucilaginibacter straminoryzae TaxID=2932774 RepID=A0A9X1WZR8_9SPHI|nr:response regulator [Mucilaginibacter straminoryzae]MCJ8208632.1 response regulator [Mucilaginibacter straminoryzae]